MKNIRRYYTVELPTDLTDGMSEEAIVDLAILQIKEKQKFYRTPAEWRCVWIRGSQVRMRYSYLDSGNLLTIRFRAAGMTKEEIIQKARLYAVGLNEPTLSATWEIEKINKCSVRIRIV